MNSDPLADLRNDLDPLCANSGRPSPAQVGLAEDDERRRRARGEYEPDAAQLANLAAAGGRCALPPGRIGPTIKAPAVEAQGSPGASIDRAYL